MWSVKNILGYVDVNTPVVPQYINNIVLFMWSTTIIFVV